MIYLGVWVGAWVLFIIFIIVQYFIRRKRINEAIRKTEALDAELKKRKNEVEIAQRALDELSKKITAVTIKLAQLDQERVTAIERGREARDATDRLLKAEHERAAAELGRVKEVEEERLKHEFEEKRRQCEIDLEAKKKVAFDEYWELKDTYEQSINVIKEQLNEYQAKRAAINEQIRREAELQNEIDYHRIILTEDDKEDIKYLISIEGHIHHKEILYKLIWSEYIQKAFTQTLKNILGNRSPKNVIYCIENIATHKKYIGKTSAEVSKRWIEHIKNSLNIGGIKRQPIHDALFGHWDEFTFSILEEVKDNNLNEREKYYIHFFETDKYGYNVKAGG